MSEHDNLPANEPEDKPSEMTSNELDEALRWLEELAGKQGKSLDGLVTLDESALEESPFKGLFDSDEQELPDWLREVPSLPDQDDMPLEGESRLDWLARMASRESVEELPTLEWRRLSEEDEFEDDDLVDVLPEVAAAITALPTESEPPTEPERTRESVAPAMPSSEQQTAEALPEAAEIQLEAAATAPPEPEIEPVVELPPATPAEPLAATGPILTGYESSGTSAEFEPDDLDEAMAWLEELAASQDSPIEDLPSVADRALASKLIAEAASSTAQREGLDSATLGVALSGIYLNAADRHASGPLSEEGPADETPDSALHAEIVLASETDSLVTEVAPAERSHELGPEELSINEVDVAEGTGEMNLTEAPPTVEITAEEALIAEMAAAETAVEDPSLVALMSDPIPMDLPDLLSELDQLALPAATSLNEIERLLADDMPMVRIAPYSLDSTLNWLEETANGRSGLASAESDPLDPALVASMPEDPDEALAWLEQMAGETAHTSPLEPLVAERLEAAAFDLTEADLMSMPDDPDEAIAWIESLAAKRERTDS